MLVDQMDESSCYGTQVFALQPLHPPRNLGFINEIRNSPEGSPCIGGSVKVYPSGNDIIINASGPLATITADGTATPIKENTITYRVSFARLVMKRQH